MNKNKTINKEYWENNIEEFSKFYDNINSKENLKGNKAQILLYKTFIFPIEKKYMYQRHSYISNFIDKYVKSEMKVADIGCGSGIYVKKMIEKKAFVYAIDYSKNAMALTQKKIFSDENKLLKLMLLDITQSNIHNVDIAISIGVLPYINELDIYFKHILPFTNYFLFNFLDKNHYINIIRRKLKFLDIRNYSYYSIDEIKLGIEMYDFKIIKIDKLATGFIVEAQKSN